MKKLFLSVAAAILAFPVLADEGMWLLPLLKQQKFAEMQALGLRLSDQEVYSAEAPSLKDAVVRFGGGCTGEMISPDGLVLTNHHCGYSSIQRHSTLEHDYLTDGFWAMSRDKELPNPGLTVTFIDKIDDVTDYVRTELKKITDPNSMEFLSAKYLNGLAKAKVGEKFLQDNPGTEVEIKAFYGGNKYYMFTKKIYSDVRLVGAPPSSIGKFGAETTLGQKEEGIASPKINTGFFASLVEMKDVMATFAGHDHDNDYIGMLYNVGLAFGRVSGWDAYGDFERGGRIIELREGKFEFDSWIRTSSGKEYTYYYPSGLTSKDEETMEFLPAKTVKPKKHGVAYTYYEGKFKHTDQIASGTKVKEGTMKNISIQEAPAKDHFAYEFRTLINISEKGVYRFYTYSDDGSKLFIDGKAIVDNDGSHNARIAKGKVPLDAGFHELRVLYFEDYMGEALEVGVSSRKIKEAVLPEDWYYLPE